MRLTDVFKQFIKVIASVGSDLAAAVADAIVAAIGAPKEQPGGVVHREVDHAALGEGLLAALRPEGLHGDARELTKAILEDANRRGPDWAKQCLATALEDHLVKPLREVKDPAKAKAAPAKKAS